MSEIKWALSEDDRFTSAVALAIRDRDVVGAVALDITRHREGYAAWEAMWLGDDDVGAGENYSDTVEEAQAMVERGLK